VNWILDADIRGFFDTISHELLLELVKRRVGDVQVLRLIQAWLKAGVMEEGKVTHPDRGSPQGGVIPPTLSNIFLHEVDRQWCQSDGVALGKVRLVRYADDDDIVLLARTEQQARVTWEQLQTQFAALRLAVNQEKSRLTTLAEGFAFLGFEFRKGPGRMLLMWPREKACYNIRQRGAVVSVERAGRRSGPEVEPDLEWVVYSGVPISGLATSTGHSIRWTGPFGASCRRKQQCPGGLPRNDGGITSFMTDVGCTRWWGR
jgi:hypothetical protein